MTSFKDLGLSETLLNALDRLTFTTPTPIQTESIPLALEGKDILGSAQTGTGKTLAFGLPLIDYLIANTKKTALIMLPTRELALQVQKSLQAITGNDPSLASVLLIGGARMDTQLSALKKSPRLIVGTPGRINDHLQRRSLSLIRTGFFVLDETDRMLDMGFGPQLETICKSFGEKPQTLMFSATMPKTIMQLSSAYLKDPIRITVGSTDKPMENIKEENFHIADSEKFNVLLEKAQAVTGSFIVFVKTKHGSEKLATRLKLQGVTADALHGDLKQRSRDKVTQQFRDFKFQVLVATDVAARGLDIPHIDTVVNYDLPPNPEDYIHRIGRTGRAGRDGVALNFISNDDGRKWRDIQKLIHPELKLPSLPKEAKFGKERSRPRSDKPRGEFKPRSEFKPRGEFKPREEYKPREEFKSRDGYDPNAGMVRAERAPKPFRKTFGGNPFTAPKDFVTDERVSVSPAKFKNDKPRNEKPRSESPRTEQTRSDKPRSDKPFRDFKSAKKPRTFAKNKGSFQAA